NGRRVDEIMTRDVIAIGPEAAIGDLVELMTAHHIKRVPVVEDGQLVGIVARADLMRALLTALPATASAAQDDARIRAAVLAELEKQTWSGA
ncbi:CBS domain-containing protein, partial [Acinetobacter baumannii]